MTTQEGLLASWLSNHGVTVDDLALWGVEQSGTDLIVPVRAALGGRTLFSIRRHLAPDSPRRYAMPPDVRPAATLYGLDRHLMAVLDNRLAVVVEGVSDCWAVAAAHNMNGPDADLAVVSSLTAALSRMQWAILSVLTDHVIVWADGDDAGQMFGERSLALHQDYPGRVSVLRVAGLDPAEYVAHGQKPAHLINFVLEMWPHYQWFEFGPAGSLIRADERPRGA